MPEETKCPKCGAGIYSQSPDSVRFDCESLAFLRINPRLIQSDRCRIHDLESRLAAETTRFENIVNGVLREYSDEPPNDYEDLSRAHRRGARAACRQILELLAAAEIRKPQTSTTEQPTAGQAFRLPG